MLMVLGCQFATVKANYGGNWSGLFCTGSKMAIPPGLAWEHLYVFPDSFGYDGQVYHYIAHDPFFRNGYKRYVDDPRLRYRRILVPFLAWLFSAGQPEAVDFAYIAVCLGFVGLGAYWLSEYAESLGHSRWLGLLFVFLPAVIVTADRLVTDGALAALCAGFALYARGTHRWKLWTILAAAALTRETGVLLAAVMVLYEMWQRRWTRAGFFATALIPCLGWYGFVALHTRYHDYGGIYIPLYAIVRQLAHPFPYPPRVKFIPMVQVLDAVALLGILLAIVLAVWHLRRRVSAVAIAACLFGLVAILVQRPANWTQVYDFGRVFTPLLIFVGLDWFESSSLMPVLPILLILPRVGLQLVPQIEGILRLN